MIKNNTMMFLMICFMSFSVLFIQSKVEAAVNVNSLNCGSYISNSSHRDYMNNMMKYYINNNSELKKTLDNGKSVVFCFEGGSDNYPSYSYSDSNSNIRNQAAVFVVKKNGAGNAYIAFVSENATSIPSHPTATTGGAYNGATTITDGIYEIQTTNHTGPYGALNIKTSWSYYTPSNNKNGKYNYCSGINVHTRSTNNAGSIKGAWSEGCQVIGTGNTSSNEFNSFMKAVAGINYNVWTNYSSQNFRTINTGRNVGYYVVDRQLAKSGLSALYTSTAINNITSWSTNASANAARVTLSGANYPSSLSKGATYSIGGTISCNTPMSNIRVWVVKKGSNSKVTGYTGSTCTTSFNLKTADNAVVFNNLAAGDYYYRIIVKTFKGDVTVLNTPFTVKNNTTPKITNYSYPPATLGYKKCFSVKGTITCSNTISSVTAGVYDTWGIRKTGKTVNTAVKSYDLKRLDPYVEFNKLPRGTYYYRVKCTVGLKSYTLVEKKFTIK